MAPTAAGRGAVSCLAVLALAAWLDVSGRSAQAETRRADDAMAFVRVVGDLRIDYADARQPVVRRNVEVGTGSGFVIAASGLVLTSLHVVEAGGGSHEEGPELTVEGRRIQVFVGSEGSQGAWEAHVVAADRENDLAALQLTASGLSYLPLGDSDAIEAGRPVRVLGYPFGRQAEVARSPEAGVIPRLTVTAGSLSAARQDDAGETRFLQTDATMLPGNSGGPMISEDGYVVGVVRMKLSAGASAPGVGFTVPVNVVKDFLEANGLIDRLPVARLRPGVPHRIDWKGILVELPDGMADRSQASVSVEAGEAGEIDFRVDRWETPWRSSGVEEALLGGAAAGFVPAPATPSARVSRERPPIPVLETGRHAGIIGSAGGVDRQGRRFRVEYAIVDQRGEKVVARFLGPADAVAFNLGLLRRSLLSLEAGQLLTRLPPRSVARDASSTLAPQPFATGEGAVLAPRGWAREPASASACPALPAAESGLLVRHPSDYTLVLRALRFGRDAAALPEATASCGAAAGAGFGFRFDRLGVTVAVRAELVSREDGILLLELEAPAGKLPIVEELYADWVRRVAAAR